MGKQARVTVASESVPRPTAHSKASAIHFQVSAASRFEPTEPPTMARPRHQLSLDSFHHQPIATSTSSAIPCLKLSLEHPRHTRSGVTGVLLQYIKDKTTQLTMPL